MAQAGNPEDTLASDFGGEPVKPQPPEHRELTPEEKARAGIYDLFWMMPGTRLQSEDEVFAELSDDAKKMLTPENDPVVEIEQLFSVVNTVQAELFELFEEYKEKGDDAEQGIFPKLKETMQMIHKEHAAYQQKVSGGSADPVESEHVISSLGHTLKQVHSLKKRLPKA